MKKIIITFICLACFSQIGRAHDLDKLLKKAARTENVESIKIGGFLLSLSKMFSSEKLPASVKSLNKIEIYYLSNCKAEIKKEMIEEIKKFNFDSNYETLVHVKDKGENVKIVIKKQKSNIKELLILIADDKDPSIIRLHGNIKQDELAELMKE